MDKTITRAYFSDTEVLGDNTISTGILSITDDRHTWQLNVDLENLKPGNFIRKWVRIQNDGTLDVATLEITAINKVGDLDLLENINVSVYNTVDGYDQGIYSPSWGTGQPITPWLDSINVLGTPVYVNPGNTVGEIMIPSSVSTIILDFRVPTSMGNDFQDKSATFDLEFFAEQVK